MKVDIFNSSTNYQAAIVTAKANLLSALNSDSAPDSSPLKHMQFNLVAELNKVKVSLEQGNGLKPSPNWHPHGTRNLKKSGTYGIYP